MEKCHSENKVEMICVKKLARILAISERSLWRYKSQGRLPRPVKIGQCFRWRFSDIQLWIKWDLPSEVEFEKLKQQLMDNKSIS